MNPKKQTTGAIVDNLLTNKKHQYTEAAHAEIFRRLIKTISRFNQKAENLPYNTLSDIRANYSKFP